MTMSNKNGSGNELEDSSAEASPKLYWSQLESKDWRLYAAASHEGLCFVGSEGAALAELKDWAKARMPESHLVRDDAFMKPYLEELSQYLLGDRETFEMAIHLKGTPFQEKVWAALQAIPYGETHTYSDIAERIERPSAVRAVGAALGANPLLITVPCHRVIGKDGFLTGYRGGLEMKKKLLQLEKGAARG
ncbi:methylated-DNA--[protein]-cysteine S-methyltransferase [Paenibacillus sp. HB172176]|uniref:methylated-DNA--[protein]-cysteine S-methyltransferase n=1 Tax=Paenibacillus sp. HB172176 TaxID=2493690 RepID=UPI0023FA311E|nr:methylated-DNA--[protein]-cysteine S-methyltransferase [Paenibacillus sp. HB172176]